MDQHRKAGIDSILQLDVRTLPYLLPLDIKLSVEKEKRLAMAQPLKGNIRKCYYRDDYEEGSPTLTGGSPGEALQR
ncbi:hypothetical protein M569_00753 [Genlisea aurea]|uniref:Uncharacterized protein n=1 Tax=Genlisea aurea TaxID=192259 RepID=S8D2Q7_9LAMI|nr:hypothetical protein M569_00753 [Genlisea aurea]